MMSKETYVGGDIIETTGGNNLSYAKDIIENIGLQVIQDGKTSGVFYGINSPPPSLGNIDLIKVVINTKYDVCHDEVNDNHDYKNFWILEDNGKHYHWLNTRSNPDDINKPNPLSITLGSKDNFVLKATFKTKSPIACKIRIKDSNNKYIFNEEQHPKKNANEEHEITFSCNTKPYKDTVQYFENFTLNFEYSEDGSTWIPMKNIQFCLYLTWKEPLFSSFDTTSSSTMQLKCSTNKNKENICETLLWIGCKRASGISIINEEALLDKIFDEFKSLKVIRVRETKWISEGLGYWRNASMGSFTRGLRTLLKNGEARCGEWTDFLQHILFSQGLLVGNDTIGICTEEATSYGFSTDPTIPGSYPATTPVYLNQSQYLFNLLSKMLYILTQITPMLQQEIVLVKEIRNHNQYLSTIIGFITVKVNDFLTLLMVKLITCQKVT